MHMLGHDHVAYDYKVVATAHLLQHFKEQVAILRVAQDWAALVATRGDEMEVSGAVVAMESVGHGGFVAQNLYCAM